MYCTQCGTFNSDERTNCNSCGESMANSRVVRLGTIEAKGGSGASGTGSAAGPAINDYSSPGRQYGNPVPTGASGASGRSILAMVLSIIGIAGCGPLTSIAGIILGKQELTAIREGRAGREGTVFAKVGYYLGIITTVLYCGAILIWLGLAILAVLAAW